MKIMFWSGVVLFVAFCLLAITVMYVDLPVWLLNPYMDMGICGTGILFMIVGMSFMPICVQKQKIVQSTWKDDYKNIVFKNLVEENDRVWRSLETGTND